MNWTKTANIKGEPGNAGLRGSKLTVQTAPPTQDSLVDDWNIDPETGDLYSYEKSKTQFATFDNSTGTLRFWNRETVPSVGDKDPEGHNVDRVFTELNYQNYNSSVFESIAENLKTAIAVDRVSFTNTSYMFKYCSSLTTLDLSNFNTSKVTHIESMFSSCRSLANLDLSNFDTSNVTNMNGMFNGCSSLTTLDLSNFNTSNVTDMSWMFDNCSNLTNLDCSHWNVDKVTSYDRFNYNAPKVIPPVWKN